MNYCFHKMNSKVLTFDCNKDFQKIILNHYIMRKVNLNNIKGDMPKDYFSISVRSAGNDLNMSPSMIYNLLKIFSELNIIKLIKNGSKNHNYSIYQYITDKDNKTLIKTVINKEPKIVQYSDINDLDPINKTLKKTDYETVDKTTNIEILNKDIKVIHKYIIEYLNEKTNKTFRHTTQKTRELINARVNEGFVYEDFCKVIDTKSNQWLNTDMEKYLRPQTLFSNKFEGYLNENPRVKNSSKEDTTDIEIWDIEFDY